MNINFQIQLLLLFFPIVLLAEHSSNDIHKLLFEFFNNIGPEEEAERFINLVDTIPKVGGITAFKLDTYREINFKIAYQCFEKADKNGDGWIDSVEMENITDQHAKNMLKEYKVIHPEAKFGSNKMENEKLKKIPVTVGKKIRSTLKGETQMEHFDNIKETQEFLAVAIYFEGAKKDGSIGKVHFDQLRKHLKFLTLFVLSFDKNDDGKVDKEELQEILIANRKILKEFWQQKKLPDSKEEEEHEEL